MSEDRLLRLKDVLNLTKISRSKFYAMIANGEAPCPVKINRSSFWSLQAIQGFIEQIKAGEYE